MFFINFFISHFRRTFSAVFKNNISDLFKSSIFGDSKLIKK